MEYGKKKKKTLSLSPWRLNHLPYRSTNIHYTACVCPSQRTRWGVAPPLSTPRLRPTSRRGWKRTTWSRSTASSGNSLWRGESPFATLLTVDFLPATSCTKRFVDVQALPPVALVLLEDELLSEACAGTDGVWRQPAAGHHAGGRQPKWDFRIDRQVWLPRGEGGAPRGSPPLAGWLFALCVGNTVKTNKKRSMKTIFLNVADQTNNQLDSCRHLFIWE